mgnify:CR=1 FL=1
MRISTYIQMLCVICLLAPSLWAKTHLTLHSPDGALLLQAGLTKRGEPWYRLVHGKEAVIKRSQLGMTLKGSGPFRSNFKLIKVLKRQHKEEWTPLWGETEKIKNHYREGILKLVEKSRAKRRMNIVFRLFNDGAAFCYKVPKQKKLGSVVIKGEHSQFKFAGDHTTWWIPSNYDTYEMIYKKTPLSHVGKGAKASSSHTHSSDQKTFRGANTPITMRTKSGLHISLHEARLVDYAGMTVVPVKGAKNTLVSDLVPWPNGDCVRTKTPFRTPWRTIQVAKTAGGLVESSLMVNLNDPCILKDTAYIEPMKYIGIWWSMHLGITTWGKKGGRHGATTKEVKRYIDFAANNGIRGVLVEGWNTGWESWYSDDNFDFYTQYDDFDLAKLARYARSKGVEIVGHHETGGQIASYEKNLDRAFALYRRHGIRAVKTGYAGKIRPKGVFHHSQQMVRHYRLVLEKAAKYGIMLDAHEPIKATGLRRTFPNMMTREGVRGMEWNAWSKGNPPSHHVNLVFTRMLSGPLDYTPGIFDLKFERYGHQYRFWNENEGLKTKGKMSTTLAKQLAMYVTLYSPMQMAADLPENYEGHPAFQFIKEVPVDWSETKVLHGEVGEYVTIARRGKGTQDWFVGSMTDQKARRLTLPLDFLDKKRTYVATFYKDGLLAHYRKNPLPVTVERRMVKHSDRLMLRLAPGGGQAITIRAVSKDHPKPY